MRPPAVARRRRRGAEAQPEREDVRRHDGPLRRLVAAAGARPRATGAQLCGVAPLLAVALLGGRWRRHAAGGGRRRHPQQQRARRDRRRRGGRRRRRGRRLAGADGAAAAEGGARGARARLVRIFNVVEHGRRQLRALVFCSDARRSLAALPASIAFHSAGAPSLVCGDAHAAAPPAPSLLITRELTNKSLDQHAEKQTFMPKRLLRGVLADALLETYQFWQAHTDGALWGYAARGGRSGRVERTAHRPPRPPRRAGRRQRRPERRPRRGPPRGVGREHRARRRRCAAAVEQRRHRRGERRGPEAAGASAKGGQDARSDAPQVDERVGVLPGHQTERAGGGGTHARDENWVKDDTRPTHVLLDALHAPAASRLGALRELLLRLDDASHLLLWAAEGAPRGRPRRPNRHASVARRPRRRRRRRRAAGGAGPRRAAAAPPLVRREARDGGGRARRARRRRGRRRQGARRRRSAAVLPRALGLLPVRGDRLAARRRRRARRAARDRRRRPARVGRGAALRAAARRPAAVGRRRAGGAARRHRQAARHGGRRRLQRRGRRRGRPGRPRPRRRALARQPGAGAPLRVPGAPVARAALRVDARVVPLPDALLLPRGAPRRGVAVGRRVDHRHHPLGRGASLWEALGLAAFDGSVEAHAVRLRVWLLARDTQQEAVPWEVERSLEQYVLRRAALRVECRLSKDEEIDALEMVHEGGAHRAARRRPPLRDPRVREAAHPRHRPERRRLRPLDAGAARVGGEARPLVRRGAAARAVEGGGGGRAREAHEAARAVSSRSRRSGSARSSASPRSSTRGASAGASSRSTTCCSAAPRSRSPTTTTARSSPR